jgi:hypothetical protein
MSDATSSATKAPTPAGRPRARSRGAAAWSAAAAVAWLLPLAWLAERFARHPNHDVALLLKAGERWLDGQRLYIDLIDVNPPLAIWISALPAALERAVGLLDPIGWSVLLTCAAVAGSAAATLAALRGRPGGTVAGLAALWALAVLPGDDFGQREHLVACAALPYLALASVRLSGGRPGPWAAPLAAACALAFCLKPHFLVVPAVAELAVLAVRGPRAALRDPAAWAAAAVPPLYAAAVLVAEPAYLEVAVPLALEAYAPLRRGWEEIAFGPLIGPLLPLTLLLAAAAWRWSRDPLVRLAAAVVPAAEAVAVGQGMGWSYQALPAAVLAAWALALLAAEYARRPCPAAPGPAARMGVAALLLLVAASGVPERLALPFSRPAAAGPDPAQRLAALFRAHAEGDEVLVLSTDVWPFYPAINEADTEMGMRFFTLWPLAGSYRTCPAAATAAAPPFRPPERMDEAERFVFEGVSEDFARTRPALLVVQTDWRALGCLDRPFDFLAYFTRHPQFAGTLAGYAPLTAFDNLVVLSRRPQGPPGY